MPEAKPSYTQVAHQVVRESQELLTADEIFARVNAILHITSKNPRQTIRNVISASFLIVNTGDGRYGWKYRVINGSRLRVPLSKRNLERREIAYPDEVRDALFPAFFASRRNETRTPAQVELPDGMRVEWDLGSTSDARWGAKPGQPFWDWLKREHAQPNDALLLNVVDSEARGYSVGLERGSARDMNALAERNEQTRRAILDYFKKHTQGGAIWEVAAGLLAVGHYKHPLPPDILAQHWNELFAGAQRGPFPLEAQFIRRDDIASLFALDPDFAAQDTSEAASVLAGSAIYQLKITLKGFKPPIWRRVQVPGTVKLGKLHDILQIVMGWQDAHLHAFKIGLQTFGEPDPELNFENERRVTLRELVTREKARFTYEYDFGDGWEHEIVVEKIVDPEPGVTYPVCTDGRLACPPEDVGGIWGYANLLEALQDPAHPEHDDLLDWLDGEFDPAHFDLTEINRELKRLK